MNAQPKAEPGLGQALALYPAVLIALTVSPPIHAGQLRL